MYLAVDIGGTKTLIACFDKSGKVTNTTKFPTDKNYDTFIEELGKQITSLKVHDYQAGCVAIPGRVDRKQGRGVRFGNLPWKNIPIQADVERLINAPVIVENDAKLAGLSEALNIIDDFKRALYITIGTGIGISIINDGVIDTKVSDRGGNAILLEHNGKIKSWESFASGKAIKLKYGVRASEITDPKAWKEISRDLALGIIDLIAILEPEVIIIGGGVGAHFDKFKDPLLNCLKEYETPMMKIPPVRQAKRPEEAVIYGCYELIKSTYGSSTR